MIQSCVQLTTRSLCINTDYIVPNAQVCEWVNEGCRLKQNITCTQPGQCKSDADCQFPQDQYCEKVLVILCLVEHALRGIVSSGRGMNIGSSPIPISVLLILLLIVKVWYAMYNQFLEHAHNKM
jgi:hypothetical protein